MISLKLNDTIIKSCFIVCLFLLFKMQLAAQWEKLPPIGGSEVVKIEYRNDLAYLLDENGWLHKSMNDGLTWQSINPSESILFKNFTVSPQWVLALNDSTFWKSSDAGETWEEVVPSLPIGNGMQEVMNRLISVNNDFYIALSSTVYKVDIVSGNLTQIIEKPGYLVRLFANGNQLWLAGQSGSPQMTDDGGGTWKEYPQFNSDYLYFSGDTIFGKYQFVPAGDSIPQYYNVNPPVFNDGTSNFESFSVVEGVYYGVKYAGIFERNLLEPYWQLTEDGGTYPRLVTKAGDYHLLSTNYGVRRKKKGEYQWVISNTGLHTTNPYLSIKEVADHLYVSGAMYYPPENRWIFSQFRSDRGNLYQMVRTSNGYYDISHPALYHSNGDLEQWTPVSFGTVPVALNTPMIARGDTLFFIDEVRNIYFSPDQGQTIVHTGSLLGGGNSIYEQAIAADSFYYSFDDGASKIYRLSPQTATSEYLSTVPVTTTYHYHLSVNPPELIYYNEIETVYSPDDGANWIVWNTVDSTGTALYPSKIIPSSTGYFLLSYSNGNDSTVYYAQEPGNPFTPISSLQNVVPSGKTVTDICYADGYLGITLSSGDIFRLPQQALGLQHFNGVVFRDDNANGSMEVGEPPLPGILISKGDFRLGATNAAGDFSIADIGTDTIRPIINWPGWQLTPLIISQELVLILSTLR